MLYTKRILLIFIMILFSCGCSLLNGEKKEESYPILTATGYSIVSLQPGKTKDQKVLQAMRASKIDAYRELSEQLYGLQIDSTSSLRDIVQTDSYMEASVSGLVKGAKVVRTYPINADVYATELMLDTKILYKLYEMRGTL